MPGDPSAAIQAILDNAKKLADAQTEEAVRKLQEQIEEATAMAFAPSRLRQQPPVQKKGTI